MSDVNASNFGVLAASARGGDQEAIDRLIAAGCQGPDNKWRLPLAATPTRLAPASSIDVQQQPKEAPKADVPAKATHKFPVTLFSDRFAKELTLKSMSLEDILDHVLKTTAPRKQDLPLLKLATFGDVLSKGKSLRHDANVLSVSGLELDYDGESVALEKTLAKLEAAGILCLVYTSPSHRPGAPRYRVIVPFSKELPPAEREKYARWVNAIIGNIAATESFTLSQAYYYGYVGQRDPGQHAVIVEGDFIDLLPDLEPEDKPKGTASRVKGAVKQDAETAYENVPHADDSTPILSIDDARLKLCDPVVRGLIVYGWNWSGAPDDVKQMTRGQIDMKVTCELVRIGLSDAQIKQVYRLGKISADADQWPRGFHADMDRLIAAARAATRDPDIDAMNAEFFVTMIGGKVRVGTYVESEAFEGQKEMQLMTVEDFSFFHRRRKKVTYVKERDADGNETGNLKKKTQSLVTYWLNHPQCRQFNGQRFMPKEDALVVRGLANLWRGWAVSAKPGNWDLMKAHMRDNLCNGNEEHYQYLRHWMGFIVQKRTRTDVIVLLRSTEEGTGKSFFAKHFGMIFGPAYMEVHNPEHVVGKFNQHLQSVLLINPDEALFSGDRRHRNALWSLTTSDTITVEPKGLGTYTAKNYLNFILTTNNEKAVDVGSTARRVFSQDVAPHHRNDFVYFDAIAEQLKNGGYEAMLHELQTMDLSKFNVRDCPKTESLKQQVVLSRTGLDAFIEDICHNGALPFAHPNDASVIVTSGSDNRTGFDFWLLHDAPAALRQLRPGAVKNKLKHEWGADYTKTRVAVVQEKDKSGNVTPEAYARAEWVRKFGTDYPHGIQMPLLVELRRLFEEKHGPQDWRMEVDEWGAEPTQPGKQHKLPVRGLS